MVEVMDQLAKERGRSIAGGLGNFHHHRTTEAADVINTTGSQPEKRVGEQFAPGMREG
jgi:hypothetical protein